MKLIPQNKYIAIYRDATEERSAGGIVLPEEYAKKQKPQRGTVAETCEPFEDDNGRQWMSRFTPGDTVIFPKYTGEEFPIPGTTFKLVFMKETDILGVGREGVEPAWNAPVAPATVPMSSFDPQPEPSHALANGAAFAVPNGAIAGYTGDASVGSDPDSGPLVVRPANLGRRGRLSVWERLRGRATR